VLCKTWIGTSCTTIFSVVLENGQNIKCRDDNREKASIALRAAVITCCGHYVRRTLRAADITCCGHYVLRTLRAADTSSLAGSQPVTHEILQD
jgi:predicted peptidase